MNPSFDTKNAKCEARLRSAYVPPLSDLRSLRRTRIGINAALAAPFSAVRYSEGLLGGVDLRRRLCQTRVL